MLWSFKNLSILLLASVVAAEEEYQWQNEALVPQCPTDGTPPFRLDEPTLSSRTKGVILKYSAQIPDPDWVEYEVFAPDCVTVIPTGTGNEYPMDSTLTVGYDGTSTGSSVATLRIDLNPEGMQEYGSLFYTETERSGVPPTIESRGDATLCVRMSLWNGIPESSDVVEVTFSETVVTFPAKLEVSDESFLEFDTAVERNGDRKLAKTPKERNLRSSTTKQDRYERRLCEASWGVDVFTCSQNITANSSAVTLTETPNNVPIPKNLPVRLCIQPNEAARAGGVSLKDVNGLYYWTDSGVVQTAVESFNQSPDMLTTKECGDEMCVIETDLIPEFDGSSVLATGKALFQPSKATAYNQIVVDFELPLEVSDQATSSAFSSLKAASLAMMWLPLVALPLFL